MVYSEELTKIEEYIHILIGSIEDEFTKEETKRLIKLGGKRLRPLFLILAAKSGTINEKCYEAAASLELLHTSSLIHDDIIDHGKMRRGQKTTVTIFGSEKAISVGGILSFFSIDKIISFGSEKASSSLIRTLETLCLGEIKQLDERYNFEISYSDYITRISRKTASLFALSSTMGGILSEVDEEVVKKLGSIGFNIGCSFQILDDILDIVGSEKETGKVCGQDICGGIITLPYLLLMEKDLTFKKKVLSTSSTTEKIEFDQLTDEVRKSLILEEVYKVSNSFLDKALELLSTLDSLEVKKNYIDIINKLYKR